MIVNAFMAHSNFVIVFKSGFTSNHRTETALIEVLNDINACSNSSKVALLMLLDLSTFHTVDHNILLDSFEKCLGGSGSATNWSNSLILNLSV